MTNPREPNTIDDADLEEHGELNTQDGQDTELSELNAREPNTREPNTREPNTREPNTA